MYNKPQGAYRKPADVNRQGEVRVSEIISGEPIEQAIIQLPLTNTLTGAHDIKTRDRIQLHIANLKEATQVIVENHYLHRGRTMAQLPYWILVDGERKGVMLFAYPRMSVQFQGYGPMNLLELARMWVDPAVQGTEVVDHHGNPHSFSVASCAVGKAMRRVRQDWYQKYPHLPSVLAIVSWADMEHHEGTIYRAANFRQVGRSGGTFHGTAHRRNGGRDQRNEDYLHEKRAFLYEYPRPLTDGQKARLLPTKQLALF